MSRTNALQKYALCGAAFVALISAACRRDVAFSQSNPVDSHAWLPSQELSFDLDPGAFVPEPSNRFALLTAKAMGDTVHHLRGTYRAVLAIRYDRRCNLRAIPLKIWQESLTDREFRTDTAYVDLNDSYRTPAAPGHLGIYEVKWELPQELTILNGHSIHVAPPATTDTLRGITDVTLMLYKR